MKTLKKLRNLFLLFYFSWAALAGVVAVGLLYWLTPLSASLTTIVVAGAALGIVMGGIVVFTALMLLWNRYKQVMRIPFMVASLLRSRRL